MGSFKIRRKGLVTGNFQIGAGGTAASELIYGSACINCPSAGSAATVVGASLAVTGVSAGDTLLLTPSGSLGTTMMLKSACCIAGGISASWINSSCAVVSASSDVVVSYLVLS